jgi:hypothetical protein
LEFQCRKIIAKINYIMLRELFAKNKNIIINTDIDGFLCGEILRYYYSCKIVGFSNSKKEIWVTPDIKSIYDPIYIDLYVARPDVVCIDQHIISKDKEHHLNIKRMGTKINPNLERGRTFVGNHTGDYYHKYPFGTVHYIIALMAREGVHVNLPCLSAKVLDNGKDLGTDFGQIILRADDALYSTLSAYADNAQDWWSYLDGGNKYPAIEKLRRYIDTCDRVKAKEYKERIGQIFKNILKCDGTDGAFTYILEKDGSLQHRVQKLWEIICKALNFDNGKVTPLPQKLITHEGKFLRSFLHPRDEMEILHADNLYSYAFIYGPHSRYPNFSYTIDMVD